MLSKRKRTQSPSILRAAATRSPLASVNSVARRRIESLMSCDKDSTVDQYEEIVREKARLRKSSEKECQGMDDLMTANNCRTKVIEDYFVNRQVKYTKFQGGNKANPETVIVEPIVDKISNEQWKAILTIMTDREMKIAQNEGIIGKPHEGDSNHLVPRRKFYTQVYNQWLTTLRGFQRYLDSKSEESIQRRNCQDLNKGLPSGATRKGNTKKRKSNLGEVLSNDTVSSTLTSSAASIQHDVRGASATGTVDGGEGSHCSRNSQNYNIINPSSSGQTLECTTSTAIDGSSPLCESLSHHNDNEIDPVSFMVCKTKGISLSYLDNSNIDVQVEENHAAMIEFMKRWRGTKYQPNYFIDYKTDTFLSYYMRYGLPRAMLSSQESYLWRSKDDINTRKKSVEIVDELVRRTEAPGYRLQGVFFKFDDRHGAYGCASQFLRCGLALMLYGGKLRSFLSAKGKTMVDAYTLFNFYSDPSSKQSVGELVVDPSEVSNFGRFINGVARHNLDKANCVMIPMNDSLGRRHMVLVAIRDIYPGEPLLYYYGDHYPLTDVGYTDEEMQMNDRTISLATESLKQAQPILSR